MLVAAMTPATAIGAEGQATTSVGGGTFNVNTFLGAGRYYTNATPITGQNTVSVNLEAGHIWNGHEALQHVTTFYNSADTWGGGSVEALYDRHATWAAMLLGGRATPENPSLRQEGIAPGTDLRSAAIATSWGGPAYALSFGISASSYIAAYTSSFAVADVINSSYGYPDPGGANTFTIFSDALSFQNPQTLHVVSAGNGGPGANTVVAPGSGFNTVTVGALGGANNFDTVASFSSRGPQDFSYIDYATGSTVTVAGVRAAVDIAAPGESLTSAFYGGQAGGNNTSLVNSTNLGTNPDGYSSSIAGTSFAAPIVAGGAALIYSAAKTLPTLSTNAEATENMVVKSLLLTGADKTSGWSNGQFATNGVITTTQSLDWAVGAGRMNLDRTFDLQVNGQRGVDGLNVGAQGDVLGAGWDFGAAQLGFENDYTFSELLLGGSTFTTSLSWMRVRTWDPVSGNVNDFAQADLNLSLWSLGSDLSFQTKIAESISLYNTVEHLSFSLPETGLYGLRVSYVGNTFDNTGGQWGTAFLQEYGVAWAGEVVPTVYWNPSGTNNTWDGSTADFNTSASGTGSTSAATTTNTQVVFQGGTNPASTVVVSGARGASGLVIEDGLFTFEGTNSATITLAGDGIVNSASVTGPTTFAASVGLVVAGSQTWSNAADTTLQVGSDVAGEGDLTLRAGASGDLALSGSVDHVGALINSGMGAGTTIISGVIGTNVTGVTQDSATSIMVLAGTNTYTGPTMVTAGHLSIDGRIDASSGVHVGADGSLGGSGRVAAVSGAGSVDPGSSPGILTAPSVDPLGGLDFNFEFTLLGSPVFGNASASGNDLLRLTSESPFMASLAPVNTVNIYMSFDSLNPGDVFRGGFFVEQMVDFLASISEAAFLYYLADNDGDFFYEGIAYRSFDDYEIVIETVSQEADFADDTVAGGVLEFTVVPEPSTRTLLFLAASAAGWWVWRSRSGCTKAKRSDLG